MNTYCSYSTSRYESSHGRSPRGTGGWAFAFNRDYNEPRFYNGSYTECRQAAMRDARAQGAQMVEVMP